MGGFGRNQDPVNVIRRCNFHWLPRKGVNMQVYE